MNKKYYLLFFVLILVSMAPLAWLKLQSTESENTVSKKDVFDGCMKIAEQEDKKIIMKALGDIKPKEGSYFYSQAIECVAEAAASAKSESLCENKDGWKAVYDRWNKKLFNTERTISAKNILLAKERCLHAYYTKMERIAGFDLKQCDILTNEEIKMDCIKEASRFNKNVQGCKMIADENLKNECFGVLAAETANFEICKNINNKYRQEGCLKFFAYRNHDASLCDYITSNGMESDCSNSMNILKNNSIDICDDINYFDGSSPGKTSCLLAFAVYNKDIEICKKYKNTGPFINDTCERYVK